METPAPTSSRPTSWWRWSSDDPFRQAAQRLPVVFWLFVVALLTTATLTIMNTESGWAVVMGGLAMVFGGWARHRVRAECSLSAETLR